MAKPKLSRRQAWRVEKIQEERRARALRRSHQADALAQTGHLGPEQRGLVVASFGVAVEVEDHEGHVHRCLLRRHLPAPVCGDRVVWQAAAGGAGVIGAVLPRRMLLSRPVASGPPRSIAANIDQMGIVLAPRPPLSLELLDRYLAAAAHLGVDALIVVNKIDLLQGEERDALLAALAVYTRIGYPLLPASTRSAHGLDALKVALGGHTSVLVGQSGVGKSSLVNLLLPSATARVGALSPTSGHGMHTTSAARLYHPPSGGQLIDSPGVREFALGHIPPTELAPCFLEFRPFLGQCRFRDCAHLREEGCALRAAVAAGAIEPRRLESYHRIRRSLETGP